MRKSFDEWFKEVDRKVRVLFGISVRDLPDCPFRDWYDDGVSASSAAKRAAKNAME